MGRALQLFRWAFQRGCKSKFLITVKSSDNTFKLGELSKRSSNDKESLFLKQIPKVPLAGHVKPFSNDWKEITVDPTVLG